MDKCKICTDCNQEVSIEQIGKKSSKCKICLNKRKREWHLLNKEKVKEYSKQYRENNKELRRILKNKWQSHKYKTDPLYLVKERIRKLINISIRNKGYSKKSKLIEILGCDYTFFKEYIESQFIENMTWDTIHLDHIKPISSALNEEEIIQLNHYTNFQPLLAKDNLIKSNNFIEKQLKLL